MYQIKVKEENPFDQATLEKKVTRWGAFTPEEAHIIIPMQLRITTKRQLLAGDTSQLIAILSTPAPEQNDTSAEETRRIMCLSLLSATMASDLPSASEKQVCGEKIIDILSHAPAYSTGLVIIALVCAQTIDYEAAKPFALALQNHDDARIRFLATEFRDGK